MREFLQRFLSIFKYNFYFLYPNILRATPLNQSQVDVNYDKVDI